MPDARFLGWLADEDRLRSEPAVTVDRKLCGERAESLGDEPRERAVSLNSRQRLREALGQ